jgi:hypothetical protein
LLAEASGSSRNRFRRVLLASRRSDRRIVARAVAREIGLFAKLPPRFAHTGRERMPTWPSQHTAGRTSQHSARKRARNRNGSRDPRFFSPFALVRQTPVAKCFSASIPRQLGPDRRGLHSGTITLFVIVRSLSRWQSAFRSASGGQNHQGQEPLRDRHRPEPG